MQVPELLAHRGYAGRYPENTREALAAAVAAGARHIEFDIQLSADRVPYLLHDADFQRTGNVAADIRELDAQQIAAIPVAERNRLGGEGPDVYAPTLAAVAEDLKGWHGVTAFVEIKKQSVDAFGAGAVLDAVLPVIAPVAGQCVVISFERPVIEEARQRSGTRIGWAFRSYDEEHRAAALSIAPEYLFCNVERLPGGSEPLWAGSWMWVIYEIVDPDVARQLHARGVGMVETMEFELMRDGLAGG